MKERVELASGDNLAKLLPLLSEGFCDGCKSLLEKRLHSLKADGICEITSSSKGGDLEKSEEFLSAEEKTPFQSYSLRGSSQNESSTVSCAQIPISLPEQFSDASPASVTSRAHSINSLNSSEVDEDFKKLSLAVNNGRVSANQMGEVRGLDLSGEENELMRLSQVGRKRDFVHYESVDGKKINVLKGLELHTRVFNAEEQNKIVSYVYSLQRMGQAGKLRERTYTEPRKWMRGKGRVTIQFGCCYNYAMDKNGNPPGIIKDEEVDPLPSLFKSMIKRLVRWHILPPTCIPNSCIVNMYDKGDCIPPHIDHHDFVRPFCTVSFLTECNILFGSNLKIEGPGEFSGPVKVSLPVGSVLIMNGNGADVAKHCVPGVPAKRISITFRKMDDNKLPFKFLPDPELQGLSPLIKSSFEKPGMKKEVAEEINDSPINLATSVMKKEAAEEHGSPFNLVEDFPPLGMSNKPKSRRR